MNLTRITSTLGAGAVAGVAAWSSWSHMVHVARSFGEQVPIAYFLPLSVDGLLVVASAAMVDDRQAGRKARTSAKVAFVVGVAASVGANIAAAHPTFGARIVAAWPAVALLLVVELLTHTGKPAGTIVPPTASDVAVESAEPMIEPANLEVGPLAAVDEEPAPDPWDYAELIGLPSEPETESVESSPPTSELADPAPVDQREAARAAYRASVDAGDPLSGAELGRRFERSPRWGVDRVNEVRKGKVPELANSGQ